MLGLLILMQTTAAYSDMAVSRADSLEKAKKYFSFAVQYKNNGDYDEALVNYEQSIALNDTVYQVHFSFADLLMKMDKTIPARRELLLSYTLNPDHFKSAALLAQLYHEAAVYDSALVMYEAMYRIDPAQRSLLTTIAGLRAYLGMNEAALDAYLEYIESEDASCETLMKASKVAETLERNELARTLAGKALVKCPGDMSALRAAARTSLALNDPASAIGYFRRIAEADSSDAESLARLESLSRDRGDNDQFLWALTEHNRREPENVAVIGDLGELLLRQGKTDEAVALIRRGIALSPGDGKLRVLLGDYYLKQGESDKALEQFKVALKDEKWHDSAQQFIWKIEQPESDSKKMEREFFNRGNEVKPR